MKSPREIIRRPVITEKAQMLQERRNQFVFEVDRRTNKIQIKQAVERLWGVRVTSVRTMTVRGKQKRMGYRYRPRGGGYTATWKKAVVTVAPGEFIDIYGEEGTHAD